MINKLFSLILLLLLLLLTINVVTSEYLIIDTTSGDITVLNVFSIPDLINYARQQQQNEANQNVWPTITPNTDDVTCAGTVSAQFTPSTSTYSIPQWYYHTFHGLVAMTISITDLRTFTHASAHAGVWKGSPDCREIWDRIYISFGAPLLASSTFKSTMQADDPMTGLSIAMMCGDVVCTPNSLTDILKTTLLTENNGKFSVQIV